MTELGEHLKKAREDKQISYDELQETTKIQKRYLQAIEKGEYRILPGSFYVRAFIKNYAEAVGLDPDKVLEEYNHELPAQQETSSEKEFAPRSTRMQKTKKDHSKFVSIFPKLLTIVVIVGLVFSLWYLVQKYAGSDNQNQQANDEISSDVGKGLPDENEDTTGDDNGETGNSENDASEDTSEEPEEPEEPEKPEQSLVSVSTEGKTTTYELTNAEQFIADVTLSGDCYLSITTNTNDSLEDTTFRGTQELSYDLSEYEEVTFNIGASHNFQMTINGEPFTFEQDIAHQYIVIKYTPIEES